jgi:hypothetical protein
VLSEAFQEIIMESRPLDGVALGISISESEDLTALGLNKEDVNRVIVELCRRFVALGAQIILGHQWRPRGVMEAVARFAQAYHSETQAPIIHNFLAWPDRAALSEKDRLQLEKLVVIHDQGPPEKRPAALHRMREQMACKNDARICLGGKAKQHEGFIPGVIEEAALALKAGKPLYMSRMMGGTTCLLIDIVEGEKEVGDALPPTVPHEYRDCFRSLKNSDPQDWCGLTSKELKKLFNAQNLDTIVQLTSHGLRRWRAKS